MWPSGVDTQNMTSSGKKIDNWRAAEVLYGIGTMKAAMRRQFRITFSASKVLRANGKTSTPGWRDDKMISSKVTR